MATIEQGLKANGQEAGWVTRLTTRDHTGAEYQELKFTIHRKLLDRINLDALSSLAGERARTEVRIAVAKLVDEERTPLSLAEKERVIEEVLDEVFGLGPLEPLLRDPTISDILVTTPKLVYIERGGKLFRTSVEFKDNTHLLRIIEKVVARVGRRVDESSPLRQGIDEGRGPCQEAGPYRRHVGTSESLCPRTAQYSDLGRYRRRQNDS